MKTLLFVLAFLMSSHVFGYENYDAELKKDCYTTWSKVFGPNAREGASWNGEYNWAHDYQCSPYFDVFEKKEYTGPKTPKQDRQYQFR